MFEKLKEKLFKYFFEDKVQEINQMKEKEEKLEDKVKWLTEENDTYKVNKDLMMKGARVEFDSLSDNEKDKFIEELLNIGNGDIHYINSIEKIYNAGLDIYDYKNFEFEEKPVMEMISAYRNKDSITKGMWQEINSNFVGEMTYFYEKEASNLFEKLHLDLVKLENEKAIFGRDQMEKYLEKNNISEELKNSHKFINLVNANIGLECTCYQEKEFYESCFHDGSSPEEIYEFEHMYNLDEQKEMYKEFFDKQDKAYNNKEKYNFLLNLVNRDINKMVGRDIEKVDERFNDSQKFKTNKELQFEDGSIIKEGTSFIIEGLSSDVRDEFNYNIHFEEREGNIYNRENGTGEGYCLSEKKLVEFTELVEVEICDRMFIKDGVDFFGMLEKDLNLDDGSFIKKDTEFVIDGFRDGKYEIHFAKEEGNIYHNDFGDKYYFTSKEINQFAKVEEHEHGIAFDNIGIGGKSLLSVKELNIVASTDYEEIENTILADTPGDDLLYLENQGVNLEDYLKKYLEEVEESISKDESFKSFGKYLDDDIYYGLEEEYDKANEPWNNIDVKPFKEKIEYQSQISNTVYTNIFDNKNKELSFELE